MMKRKKQKMAAYVVLLVTLLAATGCNKENTEGTISDDVVAESVTDEKPVGELPETPNTMIPAVMVDDMLYFDTGYISCMMRCGVLDEMITSTVSKTQLPEKNGEANFDGAEGFQYGADEGTIEVYMNNEWRVFAKEEVRTPDYIPSGVPHFKAVVKECYEDGTALVVMEENVRDTAWMLEENGEYIIPLDNLLCSYPLKGEVSAESSSIRAESRIEVWFDGSIEETKPARLGRVYRIEHD